MKRRLSTTSLVRFGAELIVSGLGLLTSVVTARNLGPAGKGALSTLNYLVALAWPLAALGAGEVGVRLVGTREADDRTALGTTLTVVALASVVYGPLVFLLSQLPVFGVDEFRGGRLAAIVAVPTLAYAGVLPLLAEQRRLFTWTASARIAGAATTLVLTYVLVNELSLSVYGGMVAVALGPAVTVAVVGAALVVHGGSLRPAWHGGYARRVVRLGAPVQVGYIVAAGAARADVLMVAALSSATEVGLYSVALTGAGVAVLPAVAISAVLFPRVAELEPAAAARLTWTALRIGLLATLATAGVLAAAVPWAVPFVFGPGFRSAVPMLEVLLVANVIAAVQWVAVRACAARGRTEAILRSYGTLLVAMLVADAALVPAWDGMGAAVATLLATAIGAAVALRELSRAGLSHPGAGPAAGDVGGSPSPTEAGR